jgi:uncharacterized SAM-binding protein YcdF (DUF218 family)
MDWVLSPLTWLLVAALVGVIAWRTRMTWLGAVSVALAGTAFAAMTPLVANALLAFLEQPVAGRADCRSSPPALVVVLAGGVDRLPRTRDDFGVLNLASRRRVERGVQRWRERGDTQLVLVGGAIVPGTIAHSELMGAYARLLGMPASALRLESRSLNTRQNAENVARLAPRLPRRISLVTSALHMPRASRTFRAAGFEVCPLATDFRRVPVGFAKGLMPRTSALVKTQAAIHELAGLARDRWQDWRARRGPPPGSRER